MHFYALVLLLKRSPSIASCNAWMVVRVRPERTLSQPIQDDYICIISFQKGFLEAKTVKASLRKAFTVLASKILQLIPNSSYVYPHLWLQCIKIKHKNPYGIQISLPLYNSNHMLNVLVNYLLRIYFVNFLKQIVKKSLHNRTN